MTFGKKPVYPEQSVCVVLKVTFAFGSPLFLTSCYFPAKPGTILLESLGYAQQTSGIITRRGKATSFRLPIYHL